MYKARLFLPKLIISFILMVWGCSCVLANVLPANTIDIPNGVIGFYQTDKTIKIYLKPDTSSDVVYERSTDYSLIKDCKEDDMYAVCIPKKELGYLYVTDISEYEDWLEVIYNKPENKKGWVLKSDVFQFMNWVSFYNFYGRKYGLILLKSKNTIIKNIYSNSDENSQILGDISRPKSIKLISIEGEWMLVTVLDCTGNITTGYIKWRDNSGKIYLFPNII